MNPSTVLPFYFGSSEIRAISINEQSWFVAKDVCDVLEIEWKGASTLTFLDSDEKEVRKFRTIMGENDTLIISESGLYTLAIRSNKPQAKPFRKWVTAEVLPQIRRTGSYRIQPDDKRVFINHSRATPSPGGPDLCYSIDLAKLIHRPNKTTIALLERITGIQLSDIPLDGNFDKDSSINSFINRNCRQADPKKHRVRIKEVYRQFVAFYRAEKKTLRDLPSIREVSMEMHQQGFEGRKVGGVAWIYGLQLASEG